MDQIAMFIGYVYMVAVVVLGGLAFAIWAVDKAIRQALLVGDFTAWYINRLKRKKKGR